MTGSQWSWGSMGAVDLGEAWVLLICLLQPPVWSHVLHIQCGSFMFSSLDFWQDQRLYNRPEHIMLAKI